MPSGTLERAAEYVARHGAELDRLHVETLLRARTPEALLAALAARQREDGALLDWRTAPDVAPAAVRGASNAPRDTARAEQTAPAAGRDAVRAGQGVPAAERGAARAKQTAPAAGRDAVHAEQVAPAAGRDAVREEQAALAAERDAARARPAAPNGACAGAQDAACRGTLRALGVLDGLGLFDHPVPERAVSWLAARQQADGGFGDAALSEDARIAATGAAAGLLAKSPFARASLLRAAEQFLAARWKVERVQGGRYAPILAYVHLMSGFASERADEVLQWCGRELERGFRSGAFDPVAVAQVFCRARARALPGAALEAGELFAALEAAQEPGGAFRSRELATLDATLCAVEALQRLGAPS